MNDLNSVLIEGALVTNPIFHTNPKGMLASLFTIASTRYFKEGVSEEDTEFFEESELKNEVSYFDIRAESRLAESVKAQGRKGRRVRIVGRLKQQRWKTDDGKEQAQIVIIAEHIEFRPEVNSAG